MKIKRTRRFKRERVKRMKKKKSRRKILKYFACVTGKGKCFYRNTTCTKVNHSPENEQCTKNFIAVSCWFCFFLYMWLLYWLTNYLFIWITWQTNIIPCEKGSSLNLTFTFSFFNISLFISLSLSLVICRVFSFTLFESSYAFYLHIHNFHIFIKCNCHENRIFIMFDFNLVGISMYLH